MSNYTLSAGILTLLMLCCSPVWAASIELNNRPDTYLITANGSLALIDKGTGKNGLKIGGNDLGIMFKNVSIDIMEYPVLKIEARVRDPLVLMSIVSEGAGGRKKHEHIHIYGDGEYHQYRLNFTAYQGRAKTIQTLYVYFVNGDSGIDMRSISLNHSGNLLDRLSIMWENFTRPRLINKRDMNFIPSPRIFNASFITILHIFGAALLLVFISWRLILYWLKRRRTGLINPRAKDFGVEIKEKAIASLLATLLSVWVIADIRNMYDEFYHVKLTLEGYLRAEEGKGIFFDFGDYFGFLEFVKQNIPDGVETASIYTPPLVDELYITQANYYLYPTAAYQKRQELFKIFYKYPFAEVRGRELYYMDLDGENRSGKGMIIKRWDKNSFIFLESQNE